MAGIHHPDPTSYAPFTRRQRVDKAVNVFHGLVRGITIDSQLNAEEVEFDGRVFTFTGTSTKATRQQIVDQITELGAAFSPNVTSQTHYLVVGAGANPCWAFSCYGRKVEKAVEVRKSGGAILIVHESDFWDAVADKK